MTATRRHILAGLAGLGASTALPAWAQVIRRQSDPYAQVDPYDDPRNGFATERQGSGGDSSMGRPRDTMFQQNRARQVSPEDEAREIAGATVFYPRNLEEEGGIVPDRRIQAAMKAFIQPFVRAADRAHLPWEAHVVRNRAVNAWAMGGGKMSYNIGLIEVCDHPGEFAAIVCHEIGHVEMRHAALNSDMAKLAAEAQAKGLLSQGGMSAELLAPGAYASKVKDALGLLRAGFSRESEYEADNHSVELMRRTGMNPAWAVRIMEKFVRDDMRYGHHVVNDMATTHPSSVDRAENLRRQVALDFSGSADFIPPGWDVLKAAYPTPAKWRNS